MKVDIRIAENERMDLLRGINKEDYFRKLEFFFAEEIVSFVLVPEHTETIELSVSLLYEPEMRDVNMEYRKLNCATDVLAFPLWEENGELALPSCWEVLPLGDIVVCPEVVTKAAEEAKKSFVEEFTLVLCHGMLHLCGLDHCSEDDERAMWEVQDSMVRRFMEDIINV